MNNGEDTLDAGPAAWSDNQYKLHKRGPDKYELYDLTTDISEKTDISATRPEIVTRMKNELENWQESVRHSIRGEDYPEKKVISTEKVQAK